MSRNSDLNGKRIVISRTDSIGDVMLTLPLCAYIREHWENTKIIFLGRSYTKAVIDAYEAVDEFSDWDEIRNRSSPERVESIRELKADVFIHVFPDKELAQLAKKARIPIRVGTAHRSYHLLTCNYRPSFTRKRSDLHEAQLNHRLLEPFGLTEVPTMEALNETCRWFTPPCMNTEAVLPDDFPFNLQATVHKYILHPKSQGSAREWPIEKYMKLARELAARGYEVFFTGTEKEGVQFRDLIPEHSLIRDTSGLFSLRQLIAFIGYCDGLVACSTGPLHISGFLGKNTIGLFTPRRPMHPGRWKPLGNSVKILVENENCPDCAEGKECNCIENIAVEDVLNAILETT